MWNDIHFENLGHLLLKIIHVSIETSTKWLHSENGNRLVKRLKETKTEFFLHFQTLLFAGNDNRVNVYFSFIVFRRNINDIPESHVRE